MRERGGTVGPLGVQHSLEARRVPAVPFCDPTTVRMIALKSQTPRIKRVRIPVSTYRLRTGFNSFSIGTDRYERKRVGPRPQLWPTLCQIAARGARLTTECG